MQRSMFWFDKASAVKAKTTVQQESVKLLIPHYNKVLIKLSLFRLLLLIVG